VNRLRDSLAWLLAVALCGTAGCGTVVQETSADRAAQAEPQQVQSHDARRQFDEAFGPWRAIVAELAVLDLDYQVASGRRRDELRARFEELVEAGRAAEDQVLQAALRAYAQAPAENVQLAGFLLGSVMMLVQGEEYEDGLRVAQVLLDNGVAFPELYTLAGKAAFAVGEFELAAKHIRLARQDQNKTLTREADQILDTIEYYRTAWGQEQQLRAAEAAADDLPRVLLRTSQGEIELELFENEAPNTVATFIWLVEQGYYNGLGFYRVVAELMAEAGCPRGDGTGEAGPLVLKECRAANCRRHFRGSLAMMSTGPATSGSRFYLSFLPLRHLDGEHTVFGRVVRGIEVLARLQRREPPDSFTLEVNPHSNIVVPPADTILAAQVLRKRNHPYRPPALTGRDAGGDQQPDGL